LRDTGTWESLVGTDPSASSRKIGREKGRRQQPWSGCCFTPAAVTPLLLLLKPVFIITPDAAALLRCCRPCPLLFYRATAVLLLLKHSEVDGNVDDH